MGVLRSGLPIVDSVVMGAVAVPIMGAVAVPIMGAVAVPIMGAVAMTRWHERTNPGPSYAFLIAGNA